MSDNLNILDVPLQTILGGYPVSGGATAHRKQATGITTDTDTTIYTVPAGAKTVAASSSAATNPWASFWNVGATGTQTITLWVQRGGTGTKYRIAQAASVTAISNIQPILTGNGVALVFEAGDVLGVTSASSAGGVATTVSLSLINIPASDPLKTAFVFDPASGSNTVLTVGAGKTFRPLSALVAWGQPSAFLLFNVNAQASQNVNATVNGIAASTPAAASASTVNITSTPASGAFPLQAGETLGVTWAGINTNGWSAVTGVEA